MRAHIWLVPPAGEIQTCTVHMHSCARGDDIQGFCGTGFCHTQQTHNRTEKGAPGGQLEAAQREEPGVQGESGDMQWGAEPGSMIEPSLH